MEFTIALGAKPVIKQIAVGIQGLTRNPERYCLPHLWAIHFYRYHGRIRLGDDEFPIRPGHCSVFPPGVVLEYHYQGPSTHAYAHFQLGKTGSVNQARILAMRDLAGDWGPMTSQFDEAIAWFPTQPLRAEIRLWDLLWQLTSPPAQPMHPAVAKVIGLIEMRVGTVLYAADLARVAGLSQNHLNRLFRASTGKTMMQYIRDRRLSRAAHMLRNTTMSIKSIAVEVGIPDLHLFNKTIRQAYGQPPRQLRERKAIHL